MALHISGDGSAIVAQRKLAYPFKGIYIVFDRNADYVLHTIYLVQNKY